MVVNLRPSGNSWSHAMALREKRYSLNKLFDKYVPFRPRTNKAHIASQHIKKLWQLVDPNFANNTPDAGNGRIITRTPARRSIAFRVRPHTSEFEQHKVTAAQAHSFLTID